MEKNNQNSPKAKPYHDIEIDIMKEGKKVVGFIFDQEKSVQKCILKCISPNAIIKLKALQLQGENRQEMDVLSGKLTVKVWQTAGDSVGHECFRKLLREFDI